MKRFDLKRDGEGNYFAVNFKLFSTWLERGGYRLDSQILQQVPVNFLRFGCFSFVVIS